MADENETNENAEDLNDMDDEWAEALSETKDETADQSGEAESADPEAEPDVKKAQFEKFEDIDSAESHEPRLGMLLDVVLPVTIELGRTKMFIKKILELERGSIIELDKMAGEPVDLFINNKKMAEGEVVVVDKHFGVRITNLIDPKDRIKNLGD